MLRESTVDDGVLEDSLQQLGGWCCGILKSKASEQALAESKQFKSAAFDITESEVPLLRSSQSSLSSPVSGGRPLFPDPPQPEQECKQQQCRWVAVVTLASRFLFMATCVYVRVGRVDLFFSSSEVASYFVTFTGLALVVRSPTRRA